MTDNFATDHARQVQVLSWQPHVKLRLPASPDQHGAERIGRRDLLARRILAGAVHHEIRKPQDIADPIESARSALPDEQMFIAACGHSLMNPRPACLVLLGWEKQGGSGVLHECPWRVVQQFRNSSSSRLNRAV